jgi:hypothetical protein
MRSNAALRSKDWTCSLWIAPKLIRTISLPARYDALLNSDVLGGAVVRDSWHRSLSDALRRMRPRKAVKYDERHSLRELRLSSVRAPQTFSSLSEP